MAASTVQTLAGSLAKGVKTTTELSAAQGDDNVGIVSFQTSDPNIVLNWFVSSSPKVVQDNQGDKISIAATRNLTVAGFTCLAQDFEAHAPTGALLGRGTYYGMNTGDHVVIARSWAGAASANGSDLPAVEKALVAIS
jgi:hypothetical protein